MYGPIADDAVGTDGACHRVRQSRKENDGRALEGDIPIMHKFRWVLEHNRSPWIISA